jgi:hypothetical protein
MDPLWQRKTRPRVGDGKYGISVSSRYCEEVVADRRQRSVVQFEWWVTISHWRDPACYKSLLRFQMARSSKRCKQGKMDSNFEINNFMEQSFSGEAYRHSVSQIFPAFCKNRRSITVSLVPNILITYSHLYPGLASIQLPSDLPGSLCRPG